MLLENVSCENVYLTRACVTTTAIVVDDCNAEIGTCAMVDDSINDTTCADAFNASSRRKRPAQVDPGLNIGFLDEVGPFKVWSGNEFRRASPGRSGATLRCSASPYQQGRTFDLGKRPRCHFRIRKRPRGTSNTALPTSRAAKVPARPHFRIRKRLGAAFIPGSGPEVTAPRGNTASLRRASAGPH